MITDEELLKVQSLVKQVSEQSQRITKLVTQLDICRESLKLSTQEHSAERHRANHAVELYQETKARNAQLEEALREAIKFNDWIYKIQSEARQPSAISIDAWNKKIKAILTPKP